jgi:asparagine synthase (glutamine-hydrolysing)
MCGFCGFIQIGNNSPSEAMLHSAHRMADTLRHRGPDDGGAWVDAEAGIALSHRRLSIIDLSPQGHQPMASASGRFVIAFNGEIYNFVDLRRELEPSGVQWRGHSDTEVMLAAFEVWGVEKSLQRFNGMFAFALWDREQRALHLARDRLGEKPLYYGWIGKTFVFGSELKALRAHPCWRGEIDRGAVALYLRHNCVPAPYSVYKGIAKLPPAQHLRISTLAPDVDAKPQAYWSVGAAVQTGIASPVTGDDETAVTELDSLLRRAVGLRMVADVPLGAFLSGGIDSSTVVALMQQQSMQPVKTFSIGFAEAAYNEAEHAAAVARHLKTDHTELYVTPEDAMSVIPRLPDFYDEPFSDSSQIPTFLVSQLARRHVTVSLSGDGGDELFGGYNRYFWGSRIWNKIQWLPHSVRTKARMAVTTLSPERWNQILSIGKKMLPEKVARELSGHRIHRLAELLAVESPDELYYDLISHWKDPARIVIGAQEPATNLTDRSSWPLLASFIARMMYLDTVSYLPDDILVKVDRASMAVSLESRVPLLDHHVVEYAWRLPMSLKLRDGQGKWLLRQVLDRYVPRHLIERPKMGFGIPIDSWLRGPLRPWAEELLSVERLQRDGFFEATPIRAKWAEHTSGSRNWQFELWDILMFQAWLDRWKN